MCVPGEGVGDVNSNVFLRGHTLELYIIKLVNDGRLSRRLWGGTRDKPKKARKP